MVQEKEDMSRDPIIEKIRNAKPPDSSLPEIDVSRFSDESGKAETFIRNLESVGGRVVHISSRREISPQIAALFPDAKEIVSCVEGVDCGTIDTGKISSAKELEKLDLAIIEAHFGVAENGAVWVTDKNFFHRSIPFIAAHVVVVLQQEKIVENMHEACARLNEFHEGYGVFISGPSKTADIEQSLVIGAQGPLSLTVFLEY
ncbi:MAG: LUD domain-containing protein [Bacteroidota bacterium]|nr:LUD domain-containing protein [Bacteroidota bacterium]